MKVVEETLPPRPWTYGHDEEGRWYLGDNDRKIIFQVVSDNAEIGKLLAHLVDCVNSSYMDELDELHNMLGRKPH